ncbi:arylsulfotransferase family protein [Myxosarcina sp. GI1]|uniref:arylsulfotransferase family protein n=1 Tax=Myxosarcina sp. GI1 TaxID=1541065 RepID=UPI000563137F|nr:arylsulfotransferase family protein [Myxosarcina sp. GI1]
MASQRFSLIFFILSSVFITFNLGYLARAFKFFPYQFYTEAAKGYQEIRKASSDELPHYYRRLQEPFPKAVSTTGEPYPGLTLVSKIAADSNLAVDIIDLEGNVVHQWDINWFEMWPNPQHIPKKDIPKAKPGANIHGIVVMENGDIIFNFEYKGLIRVAPNGDIVWRLPYSTHHSIHRDDNGNLWISGKKFHTEKDPRLPHLFPPYYEETILEVTPEGKIVREYSVADILRKNGYTGLLYLGSLGNESTAIKGPGGRDILHLNDVEPFSAKTMEEGFFKQGDVMVSLRNINTVFVFNAETEEIKFISSGQFVRQHDPDFVDGNTFSVFDNNNNNASKAKRQSEIVLVSATDKTVKTYFKGTLERPFFTNVMGKNQWLPNGNLLITESMPGRGFEIDRQGNIVWEYYNYVDEGIVGVIGELQRLPSKYTQIFQGKK